MLALPDSTAGAADPADVGAAVKTCRLPTVVRTGVALDCDAVVEPHATIVIALIVVIASSRTNARRFTLVRLAAMEALRSFAAVLRFVLEVLLLVAVGYFGFTFPGLAGWVLGLGLPAALLAIWAAFVAPRAARQLADPARLILELVLFALGMGALAAVGQWPWGVALFAAFVIDRAVLTAYGKPDWAEPRR